MSETEDCPWCGHANQDHKVRRFLGKTTVSIACLGCHGFMGKTKGPCSDSARYKAAGWTVADMARYAEHFLRPTQES